MKLSTLSMLRILPLGLLPLCGAASADWAESPNPLIVPILPGYMQSQAQNPPTFTWARHSTAPASYTVQILKGGVVVETHATPRNWLLPPAALAAGNYTWRVAPAGTTLWSSERNFVVDALSSRFEVRDNALLRASISALPRPRGLQQGLPVYANWSAAMRAERGAAMTKLRAAVDWQTTNLVTLSDANWPLADTTTLTAANAAQMTLIRTQVFGNGRHLESAALLYYLTREQKYLAEAIRRGDQMAALDPNGPTSYANQDQGTRVIALSLIRALDTLGTALDPVRRAAWLNAIAVRTEAIYVDLSGSNGRMDQYPFDSHGGNNLGFLALIASLSLGDIPRASVWFDFSFRAYVASFSSWSGPEGGYANGGAYAQYAADIALQIWQPLVQASGVNMFAKPWAAGFLRYFMHFAPPGTPRHVFGDENELKPNFNPIKAYAAYFATPEAAWYYKAVPAEVDALTLLQAPYPLPVATVATTVIPPYAAMYKSIGWTAMHSSMGSLLRTSVYFKSSPYGSFNHSHGEQNSFVVVHAGVPLMTQSGYADYYGSPLWSSWYRQTKAHNAVTYNGGVGQSVDGYTKEGYNKSMAHKGKITAFSSTTKADYVEGDATGAYGGELSLATRKLWYLRSANAVVVLDKLASATARVFEWNFHAPALINVDAASGALSYAIGGQSMCVVQVAPTGKRFEKRVGPPPKTGVEDHGVFLNTAPVLATEFLVLLDIGCKKPLVKLVDTSTGRTLTVGEQSITLPK
jgi:hypothetical protein